ncbi:MAG: Phosphocarrier protein kinase/phosphorylase, nitrogen regulation associated [Myxococcaceae bacterium]|nr:Phosphocarrier protein kinase/phosphorylase, nitrogen regulation associated [Myxococcaceae bacterium]
MRPKVHDRGNKRLDAVLDFVSFAAKPMPLVTLLDEAPRRMASALGADVCSLYLLEGEDKLVMRGTMGFAHTALGQVRLNVGEGITGRAVEYVRPISADRAEQHESYKYFEVLGEERFPVFAAVPICGKSGPVGAVVVQRKANAFTDSDIEALVLMGALIAAGIRHAELIDTQRDRGIATRKTGGGTRKVTLPGRPLVPGRALGALAALRRPAQRGGGGASTTPEQDVRMLKSAFDVAEKAIGALATRARQLDLGKDAAFLGTYVEILGDMRFRELASEIAGTGVGLPQALGRVAREATRTAATITRDPFLEERAKDVEDLCDALSMLAATDKRAELPSKAILVGDGLSVFDLLISARTHPVGVALTERAAGPRTRTLLELFAVPAIVDVQGLFRWATDGDIALIDADHGLLVINPSKSEVASVRELRRGSKEGGDS